jgi:tol-pal system protein YbgF
LGGTFCFYTSAVAEVPVVQSQADHVVTSDNAVPLMRQQQSAQAQPQNSELLESLLFQVQDLQSLVAEQRGIIEELSHQVRVMQQEQKERYIDLDRRIQLMQEQAASAPQVTQQEAQVQAQQLNALSDEDILAEYNAAKALMLEKKFDESITQLAIFANRHPDHQLTANAWYWIGEIYLVQRKNSDAKASFERIISDYPEHSKVPDSLYKLGVIAQQASSSQAAKDYFERVINEYPNSQSAKLARARLQSN